MFEELSGIDPTLFQNSGIDVSNNLPMADKNAGGMFYQQPMQQVSQAVDGASQSAPALSNVNQASTESKPWYDSFIHGGGSNKMTEQELNQYIALQSQLGKETNEGVRGQIQERLKDLTNPDRGGYFGALGRAATGSGQTTGEKLTGGALTMGIPLLMQLYKQRMIDQMSNSVMNRNAANNTMMYNQMMSRMK